MRKGQDPIWHRSYRDVSMRKMFDLEILKFWVYRLVWLSQIVKIFNFRSSPGRNFDRTSVKNHKCRCSGLTLKPDRPLDFKVSFPDHSHFLQKLRFHIDDYKMAPLRPTASGSQTSVHFYTRALLTGLNWLMAITPRNHSRMWWWSHWSWVNFGVAEYKSKIIPILIQFWPNWRSDDIERYLQTHSKHQIHEYTPLHNQIKRPSISLISWWNKVTSGDRETSVRVTVLPTRDPQTRTVWSRTKQFGPVLGPDRARIDKIRVI